MVSFLRALQEESGSATPTVLTMLDALPLGTTLRAVVMALVGVPLVYAASRAARAWMTGRVHAQAGLVAGKLVLYGGLTVVAVSTLREMGFSLAPLLGAAGVLGIALGFASQTSVSNVISGLFLIAERPFVVDDLIEVGGVTGRVVSIDTLSVQLRTFDNRMVRIPNETLVKSQMINITRYPIRRLDVRFGVAYKEDAARIRALLLDVADKNPLCLMEPAPLVIFEGFGESALNFMLGVWTTQENFLRLRNGIQEEVKARFDAEGVEIPSPRRTLFLGAGAPDLTAGLTGRSRPEPDGVDRPGGASVDGGSATASEAPAEPTQR